MKKTPLVSIIINCLNGEKYLDKALNSVFNQIYTNWEIIFFDNNSTDKSFSILKKYKDKRIKYFKSKKIYKLYKARNLAVKKCKGKMVTFLDVDDWWAKNKLKKQVDFFLKYQTTEILYSNVYVYSEKKKKSQIFIKKKLNSGKLTQKLLDKFEMPILSVMIKKDIFNQIKFDDRYTIIGDFDFFIRLSLIKKIAVIQEPLAYYRYHDSNLTTKRTDLNIQELENWLAKKAKNKKLKSYNFLQIYRLIELLKLKKNFHKGNNLKVFFSILKKPFLIFDYLRIKLV
tara:strand:- start:1732 stop:2586 length:855 start_codon:yes stop_codon:yes gene_type:complete